MTTQVADPEVETETETTQEGIEAQPAGVPEVPQGPISPIPHSTSGSEILDRAAPQTEAHVSLKAAVAARLKAAMADVKGLVVSGKARLQAKVVGILAEYLPLMPSNKELAAAMSETYDPAYHGPRVVTETRFTKQSGHEPVREEPKTTPNPYAQSVRKYKLLAQVECNMPSASWDKQMFDLLREKGVMINGVTYASPIAALNSGLVSMEAVFQTYSNALQPRIINLADWSKDQVAEAEKSAAKIRVTVRHFDRRLKRDQKISVSASESTGALFGTLKGLLINAAMNDVVLGREQQQQVITLVNNIGVADTAMPVAPPTIQE